jgi:type I restriction enzyme M protein
MNITIKEKDSKIWSHVRSKWLVKTPEEIVRQQFLIRLVNQYGYELDQMDEEVETTGSGSGKARADYVLWKTKDDKIGKKSPFMVVKCKADNVAIDQKVYFQGEHYARYAGAPFFITHNNNETKYWRVITGKMPGSIEEIEDIPKVDSTEKQVQELLSKLKVFKENEFADLLHQCHNIIRNREKLDPAAAPFAIPD